MGPLEGVRIIELVGLGPGPFVGMLLADMGAEVIAIDRLGKSEAPQLKIDIHRRGKKSIVLDLKSDAGKEVLFDLCRSADAIFEGFRPGVVEKLGIGPAECKEHNPALVYGRMTGWGQEGPLSKAAGHDLNYLALTGALHAIGFKDRVPVPPLNLVGDYGGGMFLAFGLVCGILQARQSGVGQVVDAAMVDGVNILMTLFHSLSASGMWAKQRNSNFLDGGAPYYRNYETKDGKFISLGAIEKPFMRLFVELTGVSESVLEGHSDPAKWPQISRELESFFATRNQEEWCELLEGTDACFAPVLPFWQAKDHRHSVERKAFVEIDGVSQPAPAPRFSETPGEIKSAPPSPGESTQSILESLGYDLEKIRVLKESQAVH